MPDYEKMYFKLMGKISDAIEILQDISQITEEMYIKEDLHRNITLLESEFHVHEEKKQK